MDPRYRDVIDNASAELSQALLADMPTLLAQGLRLDVGNNRGQTTFLLTINGLYGQGFKLYRNGSSRAQGNGLPEGQGEGPLSAPCRL